MARYTPCHQLYMHLVDLAEESPRTIVSGLAPYMAMESLMVIMVWMTL